MTITDKDKFVIKKIIDESLITKDKLVEKLNLFFADTNDVSGIIGWKILNQIAENKQEYENFIKKFPDEFEVHNEIGEYVQTVIRKKMGF